MHLLPGSNLTLVEMGGHVRLLPVLPTAAYPGIAKGLSNSDIPVKPDHF